MDDIDADLLLLTGGESKLPASPPATVARKRSEPPTTSSPPKKKSKPASKKAVKRKSRKDSSDEDGEESELSDAPESEISEASIDVPAAVNYASSSEEEEGGAPDLYPLEGRYKDATDKARLMAMSEIDREAVLAERASEIERAVQDRHLRMLIRSQSRNDVAAAKSNDGASGGITRRSTRTKSMPQAKQLDSKKGKLDEMKRAREERSTRKDKPSSVTEEDRRKSIVEEMEDDDQVEYANDLYDIKREEREIELYDVNRARIGRTGFAKLCDYPGFEETVTDCFVRVSLFDSKTGQKVYRLAQIKGFITGKPYTLLEGKRRTDRHLQLIQGKAERNFPMDLMSDGPVTEAEFRRFKAQLESDVMRLPPLSLAKKKADDLRALDSRTFTPEELDAIIAKRNADKVNTVQLVIQRSRLKNEREIAKQQGNEEEVRRLDRELQALEDSQRKNRSEDAHLAKLAKLNVNARQANREEIRKAELEEKRRAKLAAQQTMNGGTSEFYNPFQRVKTRAKVMHDHSAESKMDIGETKSPNSDVKTEESTILPTITVASTAVKGKKKGIDDVIASMDLGIEIDI